MTFKHRLNVQKHTFSNLFFVVILLVLPTLLSSQIYVKANSHGDGSSWDNAIGDLQVALQQSVKGSEIWVASGTYHPTKDNDRKATFMIKNGVKIYGGFQGFESTIHEREPFLHKTILSGQIGTHSNKDNTFNVITSIEAGSDTEIDGFYIVDGNANGWKEDQSSRFRSGGGWYNEVGKSTSSPIVRNCIFKNNTAIDGGAIYHNAKKATSSMTILDCQFIGNIAFTDGGAIYNDCRMDGQSFITIKNCFFQSNQGNNGACIFNYSFNGAGGGQLLNSQFDSNIAMSRGSILYNGSKKIQSFHINNCQSIDNESNDGEAFYQIGQANNLKEKKVKVTKI